MPQTVQVLRTITNNAPAALLPGAMSVELGAHTKLWMGSQTGNRLLISDNPAELPAAGANYLPLTGGRLSGGLDVSGNIDVTGALTAPVNWDGYRALRVGSGVGAPALLLVTTDPTAPAFGFNRYLDRLYLSYGSVAAYQDAVAYFTTTSIQFLRGLGIDGALTVGTAAQSATRIGIRAVPGTSPGIQLYSGNSLRWQLSLDAFPESSGNAGTGLAFYRYADNGSFIGTVLTLGRADGSLHVNGPATFNGVTTFNAALASGLNFGERLAGSPIDLSQHIDLYNGWGGFNITSGNLNIVAQTALQASFTGGGMIMSVPVFLPVANPTLNTQATHKGYVDLVAQELQDQIDVLAEDLVFVGQLNVQADSGIYTPASGIPSPGPLPAPTAAMKGFYVIITQGGGPPAGNIPPDAYEQHDWLVCDATPSWVHLKLGAATYVASDIAINPAIGVLGSNVQTGLQWLYDNKLNIAGGTVFGGLGVTGELSVSSMGIRYGGSNIIAFTWTGGYVAASVDGTGTPGALLATTGGNLSGPLHLYGDALTGLEAVPLQQLNAAIAANPGPPGPQGPPGQDSTVPGPPGAQGPPGALDEPIGGGTWGRLESGVWQRSVAVAGDAMGGPLGVVADATFGPGADSAIAISGATEAVLAFNRTGVQAMKIGLDALNRFAVGGWSWPAGVMTVDSTGLLFAAGAVVTNGAIYPSNAALGGAFYLVGDAVNRYINFTTDSWRLRFEATTGALRYEAPGGGVLLTVDASGNLSTPGTLTGGDVDVGLGAAICGTVQTNDVWCFFLPLYGGEYHAIYSSGSAPSPALNFRSNLRGDFYIVGQTSDIRLKDNIANAGDALADLRRFRVRAFDMTWRPTFSAEVAPRDDVLLNHEPGPTTHYDFGLVADELLEQAPECVVVPDQEHMYKSLDLPPLIARCIRAIQQLDARLTAGGL